MFLDADRPVLLDSCTEEERAWRAALQEASRADAVRTGVPIDAYLLPVSDNALDTMAAVEGDGFRSPVRIGAGR